MTLDVALRTCACGTVLDPVVDSSSAQCPLCNLPLQTLVFPALTRAAEEARTEAVQSQEDATCFFHEQTRADVACEGCGRFLCGFCRIDWGKQILCPACVSTLAKRSDVAVQSRVLYDTIALAIAGFSCILAFMSALAAPATVIVAIKALRSPGSLVRKHRLRAWMAIAIAVLQIAGFATLIGLAFFRTGRVAP